MNESLEELVREEAAVRYWNIESVKRLLYHLIAPF